MITFASLLTPEGMVVAGALITGLIQITKRWLPITGAFQAFVFSAILYVLTGIAVGVSTLDGGLVVFAAWLGVAGIAIGTYETVANVAPALVGKE